MCIITNYFIIFPFRFSVTTRVYVLFLETHGLYLIFVSLLGLTSTSEWLVIRVFFRHNRSSSRGRPIYDDLTKYILFVKTWHDCFTSVRYDWPVGMRYSKTYLCFLIHCNLYTIVSEGHRYLRPLEVYTPPLTYLFRRFSLNSV